MQYDIHTNKTTPYWNCPTLTLKKKADHISEMIVRVNSIPGNHLDLLTATQLTNMLIELRRTIKNQIAYREEK